MSFFSYAAANRESGDGAIHDEARGPMSANASSKNVLRRAVSRVRDSLDFRILSLLSKAGENRFKRASPEHYRKEFSPHRLDHVRIFCFCGERQACEEILSILSFLRHVGIPSSWTVVSDGSITTETQERLKGLHPVVAMAKWDDFLTEGNRAAVEPYAAKNVWGKKLALFTAMPADGVSVYIDSDILFFPGAQHLRYLLLHPDGNWFMEDYGFGMAPGLLNEEEKSRTIVNAGFLIQATPIAWDGPLARLTHYFQTQPEVAWAHLGLHFSEQTVAHLGYHSSGARALPKDRYIMRLEDDYRVKDFYLTPETVLRHYFNRSRLKLWLHARDYLR
jgi:hypothetical protein